MKVSAKERHLVYEQIEKLEHAHDASLHDPQQAAEIRARIEDLRRQALGQQMFASKTIERDIIYKQIEQLEREADAAGGYDRKGKRLHRLANRTSRVRAVALRVRIDELRREANILRTRVPGGKARRL